MSPEPTQEPIKESLNTTNLPIDNTMADDSDSDNDDLEAAGYLPLSQVPQDSDPILEDDEIEWMEAVSENPELIPEINEESCPSEVVEVWSTSCMQTRIDLDVDKIDEVKSVMASFTLPTTSFPDWAQTISEEEWKEQLIGRIKEIQDKNK